MNPTRFILLGAHLRREDIGDAAEAFAARELFVSAVEVDPQRGLGDRALLEHAARVRQQLIEREIFVAFRFGTTVNRENEVEAKCAEHLTRWQSLLAQWRGFVEITLKFAPDSVPQRPSRATAASGADYLRQLDAMRHTELAPAVRELAEEQLAGAAATRWLPRPDGGWELAAMVRRDFLGKLPEVAAALKRGAPNAAFLISGPWPLEVFSDE